MVTEIWQYQLRYIYTKRKRIRKGCRFQVRSFEIHFCCTPRAAANIKEKFRIRSPLM